MKIVKGNKQLNITKKEVDSTIIRFEKVNIDIGTGDGRRPYKSALKNNRDLFIGIDPSAKQLEKYSKKAVRKKLENTLFVVGSIENFPEELFHTADKISIIFPWGSLLKEVVSCTPEFTSKLKNILKNHGVLEIILGYSHKLEPTETDRLEIPELSENFVQNNIIKVLEKGSFKLKELQTIKNRELKSIDSTWGKKLAFGKTRDMYKIILNL